MAEQATESILLKLLEMHISRRDAVSVQGFIDLIKDQGITTDIYPIEFPAGAPKDAMLIELSDAFTSRGSVYDGTLSITVRAKHPERAEQLAMDVSKKLHNLTDKTVGDLQIIMLKSLNPLPAFVGRVKGNEYYYMVNFQVLLS